MKNGIYYILIILFISVTALNFTLKNNLANTSINLNKVELRNDNVLYIKVEVVSFSNIDSLTIKPIGNSTETLFKFVNKTKKVSLDYFIEKEDVFSNEFVVRVYNNDKFVEFQQLFLND